MNVNELPRYGSLAKPAVAAGLVALADFFFFGGEVGSTLGVFALALILATMAVHADVRAERRAGIGLILASAAAVALIDAPTLLVWGLFWVALAVAVIAPRTPPGEDMGRWAVRLAYLALAGLLAPALDLFSLKIRPGAARSSVISLLALLVLPMAGGVVFLWLFSQANPVISQFLSDLRVPELNVPRLLFWVFCLIGVWTFLAPRVLNRVWTSAKAKPDHAIPGVTVASVGLSLVVFNALFGLQNGLDLAFLWSGAVLPKGVSLADYAHRGAYPLIATALLAGLFVLIALRPGSTTAKQPWLRGLVVVWVGQNIVLVASCILRTLDYVQAYSLTRLRIAALVWMVLVAVGLVLVCWRLMRGKSARWLVNANALAAGLVLVGCSVVDLGNIAAAWNVDHAREVGGGGPPLDLCYLSGLHDSALVPLSQLQLRPLPAAFGDRVAAVRARTFAALADRQNHWRAWTWRGARRLAAARTLAAPESAAILRARAPSACDGYPQVAFPGEPVGPRQAPR